MRRSTLAVLVVAAVAGITACDRISSRNAAAPVSAQNSVPAQRVQPARETPPAPSPIESVPRDSITDSVITARIKAGILSDPGMGGTDVSVNTDHGVVSLTGHVKSQEQIALASAHAQRQDGVMRVDSQLSVYPQ